MLRHQRPGPRPWSYRAPEDQRALQAPQGYKVEAQEAVVEEARAKSTAKSGQSLSTAFTESHGGQRSGDQSRARANVQNERNTRKGCIKRPKCIRSLRRNRSVTNCGGPRENLYQEPSPRSARSTELVDCRRPALLQPCPDPDQARPKKRIDRVSKIIQYVQHHVRQQELSNDHEHGQESHHIPNATDNPS